jgi:hypothetical protein
MVKLYGLMLGQMNKSKEVEEMIRKDLKNILKKGSRKKKNLSLQKFGNG